MSYSEPRYNLHTASLCHHSNATSMDTIKLHSHQRLFSIAHVFILRTRVHSSMMRTVRCSARLYCHACLPYHAYPLLCMPLLPCSPPTTHAPCHAHPLPHMHVPQPRTPPPTVDRRNDTCLWKHYLSATTVADGNKIMQRDKHKNLILNRLYADTCKISLIYIMMCIIYLRP